MGKGFTLRLSFPSFQLCRPKHSASMTKSPPPAQHFSSVNFKSLDISFTGFPAPPPTTPDHPLLKTQVSPKIMPIDCGCPKPNASRFGAKSLPVSDMEEAHKPHCKSYNLSVSDSTDFDERNVQLPELEKKKNKERKKKKKAKAYISTFSADSGCFTADDVEDTEDTESLISTSRSFDSSSDFGYALGSFREVPASKATRKAKNNFKVHGRNRSASRNWRGGERTRKNTSPEKAAPVMASVFRQLRPCMAEGKVRESFAVVKRSENPCEDFKRSMLEMILEKQMFDAEDLEQLLLCFLSLNSRHHHPAIVEAFAEIWEGLFC